MKSIAINILLAQSGQYVFCDKLELSPYNALYTRISSSDNIFRKESSFVREMYELSNILRRVNNKSLVVGDEVCCGTENTSAISIVASTLLILVELKCSFLFATHLHELTGIKEIKESKEILIKHMMINISNDNIIFERKLLDGEGHKLYGVNICRYLKMPEEFLLNAERFRKELCNEQLDFLNLKKSNYNSKIYMDLCIVCNKNKATETHHIVYQSHDNSKQMNNKNNLVQICEECHNNEHINKNIKIEGYIDTILGRVLKVNSL
jgi:DNA mismatch repair protein MutS